MAITIVNKPDTYHAAYNPVFYELDSTNKNKPGFRYIAEIYDFGTSDKLIEMDIAPNPIAPNPFDTGKAKFDVSRILQNKVDKFIDFDSTSWQEAVGAHYRYKIQFGESFAYEWEFDDYIFDSGSVALTTDSGIIPGASDTTHTYILGDQIFVEMDSTYGDDRDLINGYFTVTEVISNKTIKINLGFTISAPASPGTVKYADFRKQRNYNMESVSFMDAVNVGQSVKEYAATGGSLSNYVLSSTTSQILTNMPSEFRATQGQFMWFNFLNTITDTAYVYFENNEGDLFRKSLNSAAKLKNNSVGPANYGNLQLLSGSFPLVFKEFTEYYDIWAADSGGNRISEKKRIVMDNRCAINDDQILFMDRKGSFISYAFQLKKFESQSTTKEQYRQYVDDYQTHSQGLSTYHSEFDKELELNTNFMTDDMSVYFNELLSSPYTYIRIDGDWYACTVKDGTKPTDRSKNKTLINKKVTVRFNLDAPVNI